MFYLKHNPKLFHTHTHTHTHTQTFEKVYCSFGLTLYHLYLITKEKKLSKISTKIAT